MDTWCAFPPLVILGGVAPTAPSSGPTAAPFVWSLTTPTLSIESLVRLLPSYSDSMRVYLPVDLLQLELAVDVQLLTFVTSLQLPPSISAARHPLQRSIPRCVPFIFLFSPQPSIFPVVFDKGCSGFHRARLRGTFWVPAGLERCNRGFFFFVLSGLCVGDRQKGQPGTRARCKPTDCLPTNARNSILKGESSKCVRDENNLVIPPWASR